MSLDDLIADEELHLPVRLHMDNERERLLEHVFDPLVEEYAEAEPLREQTDLQMRFSYLKGFHEAYRRFFATQRLVEPFASFAPQGREAEMQYLVQYKKALDVEALRYSLIGMEVNAYARQHGVSVQFVFEHPSVEAAALRRHYINGRTVADLMSVQLREEREAEDLRVNELRVQAEQLPVYVEQRLQELSAEYARMRVGQILGTGQK